MEDYDTGICKDGRAAWGWVRDQGRKAAEEDRQPVLDRLIVRSALAEILAVMTPGQREAVAWRAAGYTYQEIAEIIGVGTIQAVRSRIDGGKARAMRELPEYREMLEGRRTITIRNNSHNEE